MWFARRLPSRKTPPSPAGLSWEVRAEGSFKNYSDENVNRGCECAEDARSRTAIDLTISLSVAKIGPGRAVLGRHLTQGPLKSLSLLTTFQGDDEGSIPFTRSNLFNGLGSISRRCSELGWAPASRHETTTCAEKKRPPHRAQCSIRFPISYAARALADII